MYRVDHLRPKIPGAQVAAIDALVKPIYRDKDRAKPILPYQRKRRTLNSRDHWLLLLPAKTHSADA
jgi:hypothetical protein